MPYYRITPSRDIYELEAKDAKEAFDLMLLTIFIQGKGVDTLVEIVEIPEPHHNPEE